VSKEKMYAVNEGWGSRWPSGPDTIHLHSFLHMIPVHSFKLHTFSLHEV